MHYRSELEEAFKGQLRDSTTLWMVERAERLWSEGSPIEAEAVFCELCRGRW